MPIHICIVNSISLLAAGDRIISSCRRDIKIVFPFFLSIPSNTSDLKEHIRKNVFTLGCFIVFKKEKKSPEGSLHMFLLQDKASYSLSITVYQCTQYHLFWMRIVKSAVSKNTPSTVAPANPLTFRYDSLSAEDI